jgi:hypothetical protein
VYDISGNRVASIVEEVIIVEATISLKLLILLIGGEFAIHLIFVCDLNLPELSTLSDK